MRNLPAFIFLFAHPPPFLNADAALAPRAGHLLAAPAEITTFEHNCTTAPCVITQLHCPTAGPTGWDAATIKIYIDGETVPSIQLSLLELANLVSYSSHFLDHLCSLFRWHLSHFLCRPS